MRPLRHVAVWLVALAVLFAGPAATLGECLRCPPDCPMHVRRDGGADERDAARANAAVTARGAAHDHHTAHAAHAGSPADGDCHRTQAPVADDGPCLSGTCGHMDPSLARTLPDGVLVRPSPVAPVVLPAIAVAAEPGSPAGLLPEPPTEPPRSFSA